MSYLSDKLILMWLDSHAREDERDIALAKALAKTLAGSLFLSNAEQPPSRAIDREGESMTCITCGRPAHPVPVYVGGIGYVTMYICGLPDCWEAGEMREPRGEAAALSRD